MQTVKTDIQQAIECVDVLLASRSSLEQGVVPEELGDFQLCRGLCSNFEWDMQMPEQIEQSLSDYLEDYIQQYCADKGRDTEYPVGPEDWSADQAQAFYDVYNDYGMNMYGTCPYGQARWAFLEGFRTYLLGRIESESRLRSKTDETIKH